MRARNPVHDLGAAQGDAERHARSDAFGHTDDVGLYPGVLNRPPLAGATDAALDLVDDQQNAVTVADAAKFLHKSRGRDDVAAFPLNGLDENGGNFLGCERGLEELVLNKARAAQSKLLLVFGAARSAPVDIGVTYVSHSRNERRETASLLRF